MCSLVLLLAFEYFQQNVVFNLFVCLFICFIFYKEINFYVVLLIFFVCLFVFVLDRSAIFVYLLVFVLPVLLFIEEYRCLVFRHVVHAGVRLRLLAS